MSSSLEETNDLITKVSIRKAQVLRNGTTKDHHTIYHLHLETRNNIDNNDNIHRWIVMKRFQHFVNFHKLLRQTIKTNYPSKLSLLPSLPPKYSKLFTDHLDYRFIEKRRSSLQAYIQQICKIPLFQRQECTLRFLQIE